MICPKCSCRLSLIEIGKVEIDRCFNCEGLWFDPSELEQVLDSYSKELQEMSLSGKYTEGSKFAGEYEKFDAKHGDCPKCKAKMFRLRFDDVDVKADTCPNGHGVWLDGGEIEHLKKAEKRNFFEIVKYLFTSDVFRNFKDKIRNRKTDGKE